MKRKTSLSPTRIYTYGCLPPVDGREAFETQLYRAHKYRNHLVEIERRRRERISKIQSAHDSLGPLLTCIDFVETTIAKLRSETKLARSGRGDRAKIALLRKRIEAEMADLSVLRMLRGWCKSRLIVDDETRASLALSIDADIQKSPSLISYIKPWQLLGMAIYAKMTNDAALLLVCEYTQVNEQAAAEKRAYRAESGLSPGTYLVVEKTTESWQKEADPPKFFRYDGQGRIAVQLKNGLLVSELMGGSDTHLRLMPATSRIKKNGVQTAVRDTYRTIWIRVCSNGRDPVWAKLPFVMHRPLPEDGKIMWAWVIRQRHGIRYKYELQITVEASSFAPVRSNPAGVVAVDIGSRDLPAGEVRAAYWMTDEGARGEVVSQSKRLSSRKSQGKNRRREVPNNLDKHDDLRSIRSKNFDDIKKVICSYKATAVSSEPNPVMDWLCAATKTITAWRAPARIAMLHRKWPSYEGIAEIKTAIGDFLKQDRHLLDWETNERLRYLARRREDYRVFAVNLARTYGTIVIAKRDYRRAECAPEEAVSTRGHESRKIMRSAAPGDLRDAIKQATKKYGTNVVEIQLEGDTSWCVDWRVCEKLLASADTVRPPPAPPAGAKGRNHVNSIEPWGKRRLGTAVKEDPLADRDVAPRAR